MVTSNSYNPDYAVHPGEYLEEIIESRMLKKSDVAKRCGLSDKQISQILGKHATISPVTALAFEKTLGVSASIWNNINARYQLFRAWESEKEQIALKKEWVKKFPINELQSRNIIPEEKDAVSAVKNILHFFGVSSIDVWEDYFAKKAINFRRSKSYTENLYATMAWLRFGELEAQNIETRPYNKELFGHNLIKIRFLTKEDPSVFESKMVSLCAEAGVALTFIPEFKQTHLSGATEWISKDKALIVLSLRFKTDDHFWFSFFHEAAHIMLHGKKDIYIDYVEKEHDEKEKQADLYACEILVPKKEYKEFINANKPQFYAQTIIRFANKLKIAPGIIVGMLQHDGLIEYRWHNDLKRKFDFLKEEKNKA
jgi:HTH-type transcriptional regulator / antitoxin HigA